jgi:hypothetical protein
MLRSPAVALLFAVVLPAYSSPRPGSSSTAPRARAVSDHTSATCESCSDW